MPSHRKTVRRFHEPGDIHELTFSCFRRLPLLTDDETRLLLAESLDRAMSGQSWRLAAYVFMPEHVHLLVYPNKGVARVDMLLKVIKGPFSARVRSRMEERGDPGLDQLIVRERPGVSCFRFWQESGGYDRNFRSDRATSAAIRYIHENPVRRDLCEHPHEWRWSSARWYRREDGPASAREGPPTIHGLPGDLDIDLPPSEAVS